MLQKEAWGGTQVVEREEYKDQVSIFECQSIIDIMCRSREPGNQSDITPNKRRWHHGNTASGKWWICDMGANTHVKWSNKCIQNMCDSKMFSILYTQAMQWSLQPWLIAQEFSWSRAEKRNCVQYWMTAVLMGVLISICLACLSCYISKAGRFRVVKSQ